MPDQYETLVGNAVSALQSGSEKRVEAAYAALEPLDFGELVAELYVWVEDAIEGVDVDTLIAAASMPLPPNPKKMIAAVQARSLDELEAAANAHTPAKFLAALFVLIASLNDARTRVQAA